MRIRPHHTEMRRIGWGVALGILAVILLFGNQFLRLVVQVLWFGEVGQQPVFWTILTARAQLALLFGVAFFLLVFLNMWLARRGTPPLTPRYDDFPIRVRVGRLARAGLSLLLLGGSLIAGFLAGIEASGHWDEFLRFQHPVPFGQKDPVFGRDLGFFVFRLPFLSYLYQWVFLALLLVTVATAVIYYFDRAIDVLQGYPHVAANVRVHLSILLGILVLAKAWGYRLDAYSLLFGPNGTFWGAGYTDLHARLFAINVLTGLALIAAAGFFVNTYLRLLWLPAAALALMVVASLLIGGIYPGIVQRFTVQPNELDVERPYIRRHLEMTRAAYGLDRVTISDFGATTPLTRAAVEQNRETIQNTRLWDYRPLLDTYQQMQRLKPYYSFSDVDVDRYTLGGETRQVMLAARELRQEFLPREARRWVNEWLEYTHGYGFVMNPVNAATPDGAPIFWAGDAPQRLPPGLTLTRPQIYFGQETDRPIIAPSRTEEFDYPVGPSAARTRYTGSGGVPLGGYLRRLLFATVFGETNILISRQVAPNSRILFQRKIDERAARIAPFLAFDSDAYLVVADGRLLWVQDAYTTTAFYPYSIPAGGAARRLRRWAFGDLVRHEGDFTYVRNSVKVVTDAYDGTVRYFVADAADPVIRSYQKAFPTLFLPMEQMSPALRAHMRYPEGLFTIQALLYANYHVQDPAALFVQSDRWQFPKERVVIEQPVAPAPPGAPPLVQPRSRVQESDMEPFYVSMRLPDGKGVEFVLMLPFQVERPPSMPAWLCARSDGDQYGRLRALTFPLGVDGPSQAETYIDQNPEISERLSLWDQHGSRVLRGHMLALPLGRSVLYVKPIFLVAETNPVPRLTRVILVNASRAVMAPTLEEALSLLVRGGQGSPEEPSAITREPARETPPGAPPGGTGAGRTPPAAAAAPSGSARELIRQANQAFEAATEAQRRGDWATYGAQLRRLQATLQQLERQSGGLR